MVSNEKIVAKNYILVADFNKKYTPKYYLNPDPILANQGKPHPITRKIVGAGRKIQKELLKHIDPTQIEKVVEWYDNIYRKSKLKTPMKVKIDIKEMDVFGADIEMKIFDLDISDENSNSFIESLTKSISNVEKDYINRRRDVFGK